MGVPIDDNIVISGETKFMPDNPSSGGFDPDSLSASTTTPTDNDEIITKESSTWVRKAFSKVWDYIKSKLGISSSGDTGKFLNEKGQWTTPTDTNTTYTLSVSGNSIVLTPSSGSANTITVPYATSAGSATDSTKLPLAGGTMTGILKLWGSKYTDDGTTCALNCQNSNIISVNSIYTADASDGASEGIHFYRDATHVDSLWMNGGDLLFTPNRELGTSTSKADSQKVGRFTANPTTGQVVVTDGTTGGMKSSGYTIAKSVPSDAKFTDNNTIPSAYCSTAATEAAKVASCSGYVLLSKSFIHVIITTTNTKAAALTLNINGKGAKPIYINGSASSSSNYGLTAGSYLVYYNGTNYYFRTDGKLTADITGNAATATKLGTSTTGGTTTPIYLNAGVPTALGYTIAKSVPSNAVFTDTTTGTTYAAGSCPSNTTFGTQGSIANVYDATHAVAYMMWNSYLSTAKTVSNTSTYTDFITGTRDMEKGKYICFTTLSAKVSTNSGQFRTLIGGEDAGTFIISYTAAEQITYFGTFTLSSSGSKAVKIQANISSGTLTMGAYETYQVLAIRISS